MNEGIGGWAGLFGALLLAAFVVPGLLVLVLGALKLGLAEDYFKSGK